MMMNSRLTVAALVIAGLAGSPFAASAKMYKHSKHQASTSMHSSATTGANMKPSTGAASPSVRGNTSSEGNVGPGTTNNNGPTPGGR
ncbi:MAG TPA: hypothetical protein VKY22_22030 [Bradyrhizobium sp.]|nr:hypothetical protein [Bradyrhizobium sp.]